MRPGSERDVHAAMLLARRIEAPAPSIINALQPRSAQRPSDGDQSERVTDAGNGNVVLICCALSFTFTSQLHMHVALMRSACPMPAQPAVTYLHFSSTVLSRFWRLQEGPRHRTTEQ
jgi:hypothetical protein